MAYRLDIHVHSVGKNKRHILEEYKIKLSPDLLTNCT